MQLHGAARLSPSTCAVVRAPARAARALLLIAAVAGLFPPAAAAQQPTPAAPVVIDGPTSALITPSGLAVSIARDGTGGLVYLKQVSGVAHVFVSTLVGGVFQAPVDVDGGLAGASSQPVIAAGNGGLLQIAFINGGELFVAGRTSGSTPLGTPAALTGGNAGNPAISMSNFGKAYLAFTVADGNGNDVRTAYYDNGSWALEGPPLNQTPADDAGTGTGRPEVATAGDGVAIVTWGEEGHVLSRRVWGTSPSVVDEQADAAPPGCTEASADDPVVGAEGDSSYADVAFHEVVTCGGVQQSRVLMNRLQGSVYDGVTQPDGLAGSTADSAVDPQITMGEYGNGWVTSARVDSNDLFATATGSDGVSGATTQVNSFPEASPPDGVPATAGLYSNLIAWQQDPGSDAIPEIRARYAPANGTLGPEMVVSSPTQGPTDAPGGLSVGGDVDGDAAVAWVQGAGPNTEIVAAQLYQPPSGLAPIQSSYARTLQPVLSWSAAHDLWGPLRYVVTVDGVQVAQTPGTAVRVPSALDNGRHTWEVTAVNPAGRQSQTRIATVFVDTVPPVAALKVHGKRIEGSRVEAYAGYADLPPSGEPRADASGVQRVVIRWGDGTTVRLQPGHHRSFHTYPRPGRYAVTLVVTDKAGNVTRVSVRWRVTAPTKKRSPAKSPSPGKPSAPAKKAGVRATPRSTSTLRTIPGPSPQKDVHRRSSNGGRR